MLHMRCGSFTSLGALHMLFSSSWIEHSGCSHSLDFLGRFYDALIIWNEVGKNGFIWAWVESKEEGLFETFSNEFVEIFIEDEEISPHWPGKLWGWTREWHDGQGMYELLCTCYDCLSWWWKHKDGDFNAVSNARHTRPPYDFRYKQSIS